MESKVIGLRFTIVNWTKALLKTNYESDFICGYNKLRQLHSGDDHSYTLRLTENARECGQCGCFLTL